MYFKTKALLPVIMCLFILAGCQGEQEKIESHFKNGMNYLSEKQYQKARIEFLNITQLDPANPTAWYQLGETMIHLGNAKEAFQAYTRAETLDPDNMEILLKTASFLLLSNQIAQAEEKIDKVILLNPENAKGLFLKAQILIRNNEMAQAESILYKILELAPNDYSVYQKLATIKVSQKKYEEAEQLLLKSISMDETNLSSRMSLIRFYVNTKAFQKAEDQLVKATEGNPENPDPQIMLGNFYLRMQKESLAEKAYLKAMELAPQNIKPLLAAAGFYDITGRDDRALEMYTRAVAMQPENLSLQNTLARFHFKNKRPTQAAEIVSGILEVRPNFFAALLLESEIKIHENALDEALSLLNRLEKEKPETARIHFLKGVCFMGLGKTREAIASLSKSLDFNPRDPKAREYLAGLYYKDNAFDLARHQALEILKVMPDNYPATEILANCDMQAGQGDKALEGFMKLIKISPENPRGYHLTGLYYSYEKKYDEAASYLTQALAMDNTRMETLGLLVQNAIKQNKNDHAHSLIRKQMELSSQSPRILATLYNLEADVFLASNDKEMALKAYETSLKNDSDYLKPYFSMARIYIKTNSIKKAIEQYTAVVNKNPDIIVPHMLLGILYDADGRFQLAEASYRKALEINPRYAPAANNLAYLLVLRTNDFDQALQWARVAREALPEDPAVMDTLGLVYFKKGLLDSAIGEFRDSLKRHPDNPTVLFHLGEAYLSRGDAQDALNAFKKALSLNENFKMATRAKALIKEIEG